MKINSAAGKDIYFKEWNTAIKYSDQLHLLTVLQDFQYIHFFFQRRFKKEEEHYELVIPTGSSYRITEEGMWISSVGVLISRENPTKRKKKRIRSFKIWNTPFAQSMYHGQPVALEDVKEKDIYQYLIVCQDDWIEFFSKSPPKWIKLKKGASISKQIGSYLKKWGPL